jgi:acetolactate synthase I/II/III large subunit
MTRLRTAAQVLVDQLVSNGIEHAFCVPGESFLPVLDALYDSPITVTVCRQEGGAAMMADAVGKATGKPGICFVTRGPGATNASAGIHIAHQDSTPLIMFVGQVDRSMKERGAFQELDYKAVFGSMTKWTAEISDASRMSEFVSRAFYHATAGRPGPVVLSLPEDMLSDGVVTSDTPVWRSVEAAPAASDLDQLRDMLSSARRPVLIVGGSRWSPSACKEIAEFAERYQLPVATSYRRLPLFDALHPNYAGDLGIGPNPKLMARLKSADLIILAGGRLGEIASQGYTLLNIPAPEAKLVHLHPDPMEIGSVYVPHLAIQASPQRFAPALAALQAPISVAWSGAAQQAHADYLEWTEYETSQPGDVNLGTIMVWLRNNLPEDAIICNGAGNYASWIHRFFRFRKFASHIAPTSASMGYGMPSSVAMQRLYPERLILSINGDGDFLMNGQEFAIAVQYNLPIIVIVCDNGTYGTIRMHQAREYPGRPIATSLRNPDFAGYAKVFGGFGISVNRTDEFPAAFAAARASGLPSIIHVKIDSDAILPGTTLSRIEEQARLRVAEIS